MEENGRYQMTDDDTDDGAFLTLVVVLLLFLKLSSRFLFHIIKMDVLKINMVMMMMMMTWIDINKLLSIFQPACRFKGSIVVVLPYLFFDDLFLFEGCQFDYRERRTYRAREFLVFLSFIG